MNFTFIKVKFAILIPGLLVLMPVLSQPGVYPLSKQPVDTPIKAEPPHKQAIQNDSIAKIMDDYSALEAEWRKNITDIKALMGQLEKAQSRYNAVEGLKETTRENLFTPEALSKTSRYPIDLATVLKLVTDQNLSVASEKASAKISQSLVHQSIATMLPNIDASFTESKFKGSSGGGNQVVGNQVYTGSGSSKTVQPQLNTSWTINPGGRDLYALLAARQRKKEAETQVRQTLQEQLSGAAQDYYKLLADQTNREQLLQSVSQAKQQVERNLARLAVGMGNRLDLLKSQTLVADQQQALRQAEVTISNDEQALLNRLNLDPDIHLVTNLTETTQHPLVDNTLRIDQLLKLALEKNPAYLKSFQELKALGIDCKVVRSGLIPSVTLSASINGTGNSLNSLSRNEYGSFAINVNLLDGLGLQLLSQLEQKHASVQKAIIDLKVLARTIQTQVTTAFLNSHNYASLIQSAEADRNLAQETYNVAVTRFNAGFGTNLDVVDAAVSLATARTKLIQAVLNYNQAQVQLVQAIGDTRPETLLSKKY